jgi:hypothetical protein
MAYFRLPEGTAEIVAAGGGPLTVDAIQYSDAGEPPGRTERVTVFLDGATVRSAPEAEAPALIAAAEAERTAQQQLRQRIVTLAQSAVGVSIDVLTAAQRNALIACLLYKEGAITTAGVVRPLGEWLK